jgi:hypothetical protein
MNGTGSLPDNTTGAGVGNSSVVMPPEDGNTTAPDGNTTAPDGNTTAPDGNTTAPDGNTTAPDGNTTAPDGNTTAPDGNTTPPPPPNSLSDNSTNSTGALTDPPMDRADNTSLPGNSTNGTDPNGNAVNATVNSTATNATDAPGNSTDTTNTTVPVVESPPLPGGKTDTPPPVTCGSANYACSNRGTLRPDVVLATAGEANDTVCCVSALLFAHQPCLFH